MSKESEFLRVAARLLFEEKRPMSARELVDRATELDLFSKNIAGNTPAQTMKSKLSVDIRQKAEGSVFVRTQPGRFFLRDLADPAHLYLSPPLVPPVSNEQVLVFPSTWMEGGRFQGIKRNWKTFAKDLFGSGLLSYLDRQEAERTTEYKQVLTYVMVTQGDRVLAFKRGNYTRADQFLRGAHCIGFGGHVTAGDRNLFSFDDYGVMASAARELREELLLPLRPGSRELVDQLEVVGLLNDDSSPNGQRHLAFLLRLNVSASLPQPTKNEKSVTQLRWLDPNSSPDELWKFEYWSQLCLLAFYQRKEIAKPAFLLRKTRNLQPPSIVAIVGPLGCGKSLATKILRETYGYTEVNSGQVIAQLLGRPTVTEVDRELFQEAAHRFISAQSGPRRLAMELWAHISRGGDRVLVDGVRQRSTLDELRRFAGVRRVGLLFVNTPPHLAYEFYSSRPGGNVGILAFLRRRTAPVELEVEGLLAESDAVLYNWKGRSDYRIVISRLMRDLGVARRRG